MPDTGKPRICVRALAVVYGRHAPEFAVRTILVMGLYSWPEIHEIADARARAAGLCDDGWEEWSRAGIANPHL